MRNRVVLLSAISSAIILLGISVSTIATPNGLGLTISVNSTQDATDAVPGNGICATSTGACTLRAAIMETNASPGSDTIILPSGVYTLTILGRGENFATLGDLDIRDALVITGDGPDLTIVNANFIDRVFEISSTVPVSMIGITIRNGDLSGSSGDGGGIQLNGDATLLLDNTTVISNTSRYGGGINANGIGISTTLTVTNSSIVSNTATGNGGGIFSYFTFVTISNSSIRGNAAQVGGGISIELRSFDISGTTISGNRADYFISGSPYAGGMYVSSYGQVRDSQIISNTAQGSAGGIYSTGYIALINTTISGNSATPDEPIFPAGGGLYLLGGGSIDSSLITNNTAKGYGGGLYTHSGGSVCAVAANLTITNTTISSNTAGLDGGGISDSNCTSIINSTVSGNTAGAYGGGIWHGFSEFQVLYLNNVTITGNTADSDNDDTGDGGGIRNYNSTVNLRNTIIGGNADNSPTTRNSDCSGTIISYGYNLIQDITGCFVGLDTTGNLTGVAPGLGPLQDNGGSTPTHALLPDSPAIDAANPAGCTDGVTTLTTDQRDYSRMVDGDGNGSAICDMGSYEFGSSPAVIAEVSIVKTDAADPVRAGETLTYTISISNAGPHSAPTVTVIDTLPSGVSFASASGSNWGCGHASSTVTCTTSSMMIGPAPVITILATAPNNGGLITNTASVNSTAMDADMGNNTAVQSTLIVKQFIYLPLIVKQ